MQAFFKSSMVGITDLLNVLSGMKPLRTTIAESWDDIVTAVKAWHDGKKYKKFRIVVIDDNYRTQDGLIISRKTLKLWVTGSCISLTNLGDGTCQVLVEGYRASLSANATGQLARLAWATKVPGTDRVTSRGDVWDCAGDAVFDRTLIAQLGDVLGSKSLPPEAVLRIRAKLLALAQTSYSEELAAKPPPTPKKFIRRVNMGWAGVMSEELIPIVNGVRQSV